MRIGNIAIQPDPPEHKLDSGGSFRVPGCCKAWVRQFEDSGYCNVWQKRTLPRIKRRESREPMALWRRVGGAQPQRPPRGKHSKANVIAQKRTLPRIKRRESRESKTLWHSLGRPQCGFHISAPAFSPRYHIESANHIKRNAYPTRRSFSYKRLRSSPRRDRHKETHKPEVNPISTITSVPFENVLRRSRPARNRNAACRKPSCLARMRQTAGVRRTQNVATELLYPNKHTVKSSNPIDRNILL